jgi:hypothetical protein
MARLGGIADLFQGCGKWAEAVNDEYMDAPWRYGCVE